jgi:hypothetical protein
MGTSDALRGGPGPWAGPALALLLAGCGPGGPRPPVYEEGPGVRFTPPPGWVERDRPNAVPGGADRGHPRGRARPDLPLPGLSARERLLVRYDRLTAGALAWLRLTAAEAPAATALEACLAAHAPGPGWRREGKPEDLDVGGLPAARVAFRGRWDNQDYLCETVAVRRGGRVYCITASFPASDGAARAQVRQAVAGAVWP